MVVAIGVGISIGVADRRGRDLEFAHLAEILPAPRVAVTYDFRNAGADFHVAFERGAVLLNRFDHN